MAAERLSMHTIREILRLKWDCQRTNREIAQSCGIARSSVAECLVRARDAGLTWPLPSALDDGTHGQSITHISSDRPRGHLRLAQALTREIQKAEARLEEATMR